MVTKIATPNSVEATSSYNTKKIQQGKAICLYTASYLNEAQEMNFYHKLEGLEVKPFLVYKHEDTGHPHIHIVATTIKADASRINTLNLGRNQSEKARKEIEKIFQPGESRKSKAIVPESKSSRCFKRNLWEGGNQKKHQSYSNDHNEQLQIYFAS